eukprot:130241-Heterocapsa_arctica.AAC.1
MRTSLGNPPIRTRTRELLLLKFQLTVRLGCLIPALGNRARNTAHSRRPGDKPPLSSRRTSTTQARLAWVIPLRKAQQGTPRPPPTSAPMWTTGDLLRLGTKKRLPY